jgi:preprotein translocase subunit YajC
MSLFELGSQGRNAWLPFLVAMGTPQAGVNPAIALLPYVLVIGVFYFVLIRPMKSRQQKVQVFLDGLKVGDRVVTSGGIHGSITRVEKDKLQLQIADKVRVDISRNAVVGYQDQEPVVTSEGGPLGSGS